MADSINFNYSEVDSTLNNLKNANDTLNNSFISNKTIFELDDLIELLNINYFSSLTTFVKATYEENDKYITVGRSYYEELLGMNGSYNYDGENDYDENNSGDVPTDTPAVGDVAPTMTADELSSVGEPAATAIAAITGGTNADDISDDLDAIASAVEAIAPYVDADAAIQLQLLQQLVNGGPVNGIELPPEAIEFCIGYIEAATGLTIEELLSGKYPEKLDAAIKALAQALAIIKQASNLSEEELEMAMSGDAEEIATLSTDEKTDLMLLLLNLIKENGGIAGIYENPELMEQLNAIADVYNSLTDVSSMTSQQKIDVLSGLFGDNPTINGFTIPTEIRDYILAQIQAKTGLTLEQILSGDYPEALDAAFAEVMAILNSYGVNALYSTEDKINILNGLLGDNPTINGIAIPLELRDAILAQIQAATGLTLEQLLSGQYPDLLELAFSEMLGIVQLYGIFGSVSQEEMEKFMEHLLDGQYPEVCGITAVTAKTMRDYLLAIAEANGITIEELLSDPKYADYLKQELANFAASQEEIANILMLDNASLQELLLGIYDGDSVTLNGVPISEETINIIRVYLDNLALSLNISVETLLTDPQYQEILRKAMNDLNKYLSFMDLMTMMESEEIQARLLQMINGERAGLLGFTNENLTEFNKILEDYETTNNTTREDLLTNTEFASKTAELLNNTDVGKEISLLFPEYNEQQKQEVLNKIMISWNEDNENRIMNLFEYINNQNIEAANN